MSKLKILALGCGTVFILLILGFFGIGFLLFGNKILGGMLYSSKEGYLLDIQQIENSCAEEVTFYIAQDADKDKVSSWAKTYGLTLRSSPRGQATEIRMDNSNWKETVKEGRQNNLFSSYLMPPPPLEDCN